MNPARLVDELARSRTWTVYGSRFNKTGRRGVNASICLIAGVAVAEVHITRHLPSVARALARSGYTVRRIEWAFARRALRRGDLA